ncbi:MAG: asparagine synthase (glutamine-hydrolyzing) [Candidatus Sumerlaeaceae bacterium]
MCGIVGKVNRDPARPVNPEQVALMKRCIVHRGPDEEGTYLDAPAGLGFQRLAIIDLKCGQQPMFNEDGSLVIVFNGEIYNYPQLREELLAHGHVFQTHSDTETILHGYEQWGPDVTRRLRGMFAFAIWNKKLRSLFLARDRTGKKPLYWAQFREGAADESLVFASELKAILADPAAERRVDTTALSHYLTYQYVPQPWSIYQGIQKLPPAHWLMYEGGHVTVERYWKLEFGPKLDISMDEAMEGTLAELDEAVRVRLMSEVPLGCFLSGGVDSSAVVAMMRRHISGPLRTFSIGFNEREFNELDYARQVAQQFSTEHQEFIVEPNALECLGLLAWHFDEPFADSSAIPTYYLSKMTRQHVTVALNGDGGDESFAGYSRYMGFPAFNRYGKIPRALRQVLSGPSGALARIFPNSARADLLAYANRVSLLGEDHLYVQLMVIFRDYQKRQVMGAAYKDTAGSVDSEQLTVAIMQQMRGAADIDRKMFADIEMYLPGALLPKVDRMTMANSLEGRSPFLDGKLMEYAARLPAELKFKAGDPKHLLKQALLRIFPREFLYRPKMGFGVPVGEWFRSDLRGLTEELLLDTRARSRGYLDPGYVQKLVNQHVSGQHNHSHRIWSLLMFEAWARTFLDRADPLRGPITFAL